MYKNTINTKVPAAYQRASAQILSLMPPQQQVARRAHQKAVRPHSWKGIIGGSLLCLVAAMFINVIIINAVFFPGCDRENNDCFLIQYLWGAE